MFGLPIEVVLSLATGVGGFLMKQAAQRQADMVSLVKLNMEVNEHADNLANSAAKRSSPFVRKAVALFVIVSLIGALIWVSTQPDVVVSVLEPKPQKSILWGLFTWGKTLSVTTAEGLVFPTWIKYSVLSIIGFLFGTGAAKIK